MREVKAVLKVIAIIVAAHYLREGFALGVDSKAYFVELATSLLKLGVFISCAFFQFVEVSEAFKTGRSVPTSWTLVLVEAYILIS